MLAAHEHLPNGGRMTGPVSVRRPTDRQHFRRPPTRSLDAVLPTLYLRGVSSGDFQEALEALLGKDASGLSAQVTAA